MQNTPMDLMSTLQIVGIVTATAMAMLWRKPLLRVVLSPITLARSLMQSFLGVYTMAEANERHKRHEKQIRNMDLAVTVLRDRKASDTKVIHDMGIKIALAGDQQNVRDQRHNSLRREVENLGIVQKRLAGEAEDMQWDLENLRSKLTNHVRPLGKRPSNIEQGAAKMGIPADDLHKMAFDIETALGGLHIVPMGDVPKPIVTPPQAVVHDQMAFDIQHEGLYLFRWSRPEADPLSAILEAKKRMERAASIPRWANIDYSGLELRMMAQALLGGPLKGTLKTTGRTSSKPTIFTRDEATDSPDVPYLTERELELKEKGNYGIVPLTLNQRRAQAGNTVPIQDDSASLRRFLRHQAKVVRKVAVARETEMFRRLFMIPSMIRPESMYANGGAIDFNGHNTGFQSGGPGSKTILDFTPYGRGAK